MRFRTVAASATFVLCASTGAAACSSSPGPTDATRPAAPAVSATPVPAEGMAGHIETGRRQAGPPPTGGQDGTGPAKCATSAAAIPAECALDLSFPDVTEGKPATEPPVR
ncbi:hypothetical protein [Streptomyces sp. NPDC006267]|uniref:hypothetical protein n=1 Tax=Streptomyces sp. NPDC006267 TaxID=3157173 RepID=UPI0033A5229A